MLSFSDIHLDIIYRIIYWYTRRAVTDLAEWKNALSILSVCSTWRQYGVKLMYSNAFIVDRNFYIIYSQSATNKKSAYNPDYPYAASNLGLIKTHGYCSDVKRLAVMPGDSEDLLDIVCYINYFVGATEATCPGTDMLMGYDSDNDISFSTYRVDPMFGSISHCLSLMLKEKLPKVSSLDIYHTGSSSRYYQFIPDILNAYLNQLICARYIGHAYLNSVGSNSLKSLTLLLSFFNSASRNPTISLHSLQKLFLQTDSQPIDWSFFESDEFGRVSCETLESLTILADPGQLPEAPSRWSHVNFPNLKHLAIANQQIHEADVEQIFRSPLQSLELHGLPSKSLLYCQQDISKLHKLTLDYQPRTFGKIAPQDFVAYTSDILACAANINHVYLKVDVRGHYFKSQFNWANLTHLNVSLLDDIAQTLCATAYMPDLCELHVHMYSPFADYEKESKWIDELKATYPQPSASKIMNLKIYISRQAFADSLKASLENALCLFPRLCVCDISIVE
ncbi:hypothetical protein IWW36_003960 [Coemansia brasiliensis]|uniref:Uncharacterized protein n=1 Tax=Coemansia brasiliensis TaxID=2650707 RepID=A0A9W8I979_9FUNG|nr:hypothetical protein IWW36_003960 [Coemansia brasiliensis]